MDTGMAPTPGNVIVRASNLVFDSSMVRSPYILSTSAPGGTIIPPGQQNVPQLLSDFSNSLEWPFEVTKIGFQNDPSHTYRDWRVRVVDQTYNQEWMKNPILVAALINAETGFWELPMPWVIRSQGGGQNWFVDNLDAVNPIQITITLFGSLQFPTRGQ
jgi:hypothetical protein